MKKILIVLSLAFMLVGCGNSHDAKLSNGEEEIWVSNSKKYTKNDLFEYLKAQDYSSIVISNIINKIAEYENIDVESIKKQAQDEVDEIIAEGYESYLEYYYGSADLYIENTVYSATYLELAKNEALANYDTYKEELMPYKAEIAYFNTEEEAKNVINAVNNNEHTFAFAASENGYSSDITATIYTDSSDLPVEVKDAVLNGKDTGLTDIIQSSTYATDSSGTSTITPRYYVVNIISKDVDSFKDEFIQTVAATVIKQDELIADYLDKYNVQIHDQRTYELLKDKYGDLR